MGQMKMRARPTRRSFFARAGVFGVLGAVACSGAPSGGDLLVYSVVIAGHVYDGENRPVPGVALDLYSYYQDCVSGQFSGRGKATTDANGSFAAEVIGASAVQSQCIAIRAVSGTNEATAEVRSPRFVARVSGVRPDTVRIDLRFGVRLLYDAAAASTMTRVASD